MAARRCSLCGISYPIIAGLNKCEVCYETIDNIDAQPDPDWKNKVERIKTQIERAPTGLPNELPDAQAKIRKQRLRGLLWVSKDALLAAGYRNMYTFQIVKLNGKFYELQGYNSSKREWWIEEIKDTFDEKDLHYHLERRGT